MAEHKQTASRAIILPLLIVSPPCSPLPDNLSSRSLEKSNLKSSSSIHPISVQQMNRPGKFPFKNHPLNLVFNPTPQPFAPPGVPPPSRSASYAPPQHPGQGHTNPLGTIANAYASNSDSAPLIVPLNPPLSSHPNRHHFSKCGNLLNLSLLHRPLLDFLRIIGDFTNNLIHRAANLVPNSGLSNRMVLSLALLSQCNKLLPRILKRM
jgi:hypothetical protein